MGDLSVWLVAVKWLGMGAILGIPMSYVFGILDDKLGSVKASIILGLTELIPVLGLMCGFENCAAMMKAGANCAFNVTDLGIAVGSAVSVAANHHIDNRVMYSIGRAAIRAGVFKKDVRVCYGIPLSVSSKSIFFDREPGAVLR